MIGGGMSHRGMFRRKVQDAGLPFIFSVTVGAGQSFQLPTIDGGTYNAVIDWGDGDSDVLTVWNATERTHTFSLAGTYDIEISGIFEGWRSPVGWEHASKVSEIKQWGILKLIDRPLGGYFYGLTNLQITATDILNVEHLTSFYAFFQGCASLTTIPNFTSWNTSNVEVWGYMFYECSTYNQSLNGLNTSAGTNFSYMFRYATAFNGDMDALDMTSAESFVRMFSDTSFNKPIPWDTPSLIDANRMFIANSSFDQDISSWTFTNVISLDFFMNTGGFSKTNYDALLVELASQTLQSGVTARFSASKYSAAPSAAATARASIISTYSWTIIDGGAV